MKTIITYLNGPGDQRTQIALRPEREVECEAQAREVNRGEGQTLGGNKVLDVVPGADEYREAVSNG